MNIESKFIIIMITFFALFSCMTIISAADVHNANYTDTHNQVINEQSTINEPVINTEIKTLNRENNNIQTNQRNNQNNDKFQDQQSKLNSKEMKSLSQKRICTPCSLDSHVHFSNIYNSQEIETI